MDKHFYALIKQAYYQFFTELTWCIFTNKTLDFSQNIILYINTPPTLFNSYFSSETSIKPKLALEPQFLQKRI